jgi:hypothetical protein
MWLDRRKIAWVVFHGGPERGRRGGRAPLGRQPRPCCRSIIQPGYSFSSARRGEVFCRQLHLDRAEIVLELVLAPGAVTTGTYSSQASAIRATDTPRA